jgi:ribosome biogenesis GTPase A
LLPTIRFKALINDPCIIVNVVDIFDFEGSFINALKRIVGNKKIILAANKLDLLPKQVRRSSIPQPF